MDNSRTEAEKIVKEECGKLEGTITESVKRMMKLRLEQTDVNPVTSGALAFITYKYLSEAIDSIIFKAIRESYEERLADQLSDTGKDIFGNIIKTRDDPAYG